MGDGMIDKIYKISKMGHIIRSGIILSRETCVDELNKISQLEARNAELKKRIEELKGVLR